MDDMSIEKPWTGRFGLKLLKIPYCMGLGILLILFGSFKPVPAQEFPSAGWHRGDVSVAQENSRKAILAALQSSAPNVEVDILDFVDRTGARVGLLAHETNMERITGSEGRFLKHDNLFELPSNSAEANLAPEPFMTVIEFFEAIAAAKKNGVIPLVSLDLKEDGASGEAFGRWVGNLIRTYGFQKHVFASSFFKSNVAGVDAACPECLTGGLVFTDHFALKYLNHRYSTLDLTGFSKATFFLGFLGKRKYPHDFVLIQDDVFLSEPELVDYWKDARNVKFVGVFVYDKTKPYSKKEWELLDRADWLELDAPQMEQWLIRRGKIQTKSKQD